jgi:hypothetical protein
MLSLVGFKADLTLVPAIWWGSVNSMNVEDLWPYIFVSILFFGVKHTDLLKEKAYVSTLQFNEAQFERKI